MTTHTTTQLPWNDTNRTAADRVEALIADLTLEEKLAQLYSVWVGATVEGEGVAPHQNDMGEQILLDDLAPNGLGQITRAFGTAPIDPAEGALHLMRMQRQIMAESRHGIPAVAHEECLSGFTTWKATTYPVPLSWGATFDPELVERIASKIGSDLRSVGVQQALAPVMDVARDLRWGRVEETIGEDPYLVGTVGTAYVRGLESTGIVSTLKHFVGYSQSKAARNLAPVSIGPRELADVLLPPFEMALRHGGARSVMHSYSDLDGVPAAASEELLTDLLRDAWGFDGTVVADYFGIGFLKLVHGVAGTWGEAAAKALVAGVDVELPIATAYRRPLLEAVRAGDVAESLVDRALRRVLLQKLELGLLDADWSPVPPVFDGVDLSDESALSGTVDLDDAEGRGLAREVAERAVVLLHNDGLLPIADEPRRVALVGPSAAEAMVMLGCYAFPNHVGLHHPTLPIGVDIPTVEESLRAEFPAADFSHVAAVSFAGADDDDIAAAVSAARDADLVVVTVGDRAALFGRGTSGEGCDAESLALPGRQGELLEAVLDTGTDVIVLVISGRPYHLGTAPARARGIIQAFFPGEEGGPAIAGVISGRVRPSGRLPVSIPSTPGAQPATYLAAPLAQRSDVSNIDPTPLYPFGFGIGYEKLDWVPVASENVTISIQDGATMSVSVRLENSGDRAVRDVAQVYLHDPVARTVRPVRRLVAYRSVLVEAGSSVDVRFDVPIDLAAFSDGRGGHLLEPGRIDLILGSSSADSVVTRSFELTGAQRVLGHERHLVATSTITPVER